MVKASRHADLVAKHGAVIVEGLNVRVQGVLLAGKRQQKSPA